MSIPLIEAPVSDEVRAAVAEGWKAYEAATREHGPTDNLDKRIADLIDKQVIDDVIAAFAAQRRPFSANDIRPHLPVGVRKCLISRRLIVARHRGLIRRVGFTPSSLKSTNSALIRVYTHVPVTTGATS